MIRSPSISSGLAAALVLAALVVPISAAAQSRVTFGGDTWVRPGETVDDLVVFGADARVDGRVRGDAIVFGGRLEVGPDAVIDGDQVVLGGEVVTSHGARVSGDRVGIGASYSDGPAAAAEEAREASRDAAEEAREAARHAAEEAREAGRHAAEEAREAGRRAAEEAREAGRRAAEEAREAAGLAGKVADSVREAQGRSGGSFSRAVPFLASWIGLFALGIVLLGIWPEGVRNVRRTAAAAPLRGAVVGFLLVMALSALTPLLAITIVGIPVVVALWLGLIGVSLLGFVGLAERLGELLPGGSRASREVLLLLGAALALLPLLLPSPFLAVPVICLLWFLAVGISVLSRLGRRPYG